jgi:cytochrome P450
MKPLEARQLEARSRARTHHVRVREIVNQELTTQQLFQAQAEIKARLHNVMHTDWTNQNKIQSLRIELRAINQQIAAQNVDPYGDE